MHFSSVPQSVNTFKLKWGGGGRKLDRKLLSFLFRVQFEIQQVEFPYSLLPGEFVAFRPTD